MFSHFFCVESSFSVIFYGRIGEKAYICSGFYTLLSMKRTSKTLQRCFCALFLWLTVLSAACARKNGGTPLMGWRMVLDPAQTAQQAALKKAGYRHVSLDDTFSEGSRLITYDSDDLWSSVKRILAGNLCLSAYCTGGHFNDMNTLEVGRSMSSVEDETHFGMWCLMSSPLIIGDDLTSLADKPATLLLLTNPDLIALNQDPLHLQAEVYQKEGECFILAKDIQKLQGRKRAIGIYNPSDTDCTVNLNLEALELGGSIQLYDCFSRSAEASFSSSETHSVTVPAHGCRIFLAKGQTRVERKYYGAACAWSAGFQGLLPSEDDAVTTYEPHANSRCGYVASHLGKRAEDDLQWRNIFVNKDGKRWLTISYFSSEPLEMLLEVNGQLVTKLKATSRNILRRSRVMVEVALLKGNNTIRLFNPSGAMPNIEGLEVGEAEE